jgi:phenylalanyl-tRNA synthetase beta chain
MGHNVTPLSKDSLLVEIAAWRSDILHEVDLIEDVAVGYGYDQFSMDFPKAMTFGRLLPSTQSNTQLRLLLIGLGFHEVTTFSISNDQDEFKKMGKKPEKWVEIANPIGEEFNGMRTSLLPSMLKLLRENRHHPLPQPIFEVGVVIDGTAKNRWHLAGIKVDAKANFTECKSIVEAIGRGCGCPFSFAESTNPIFINGRSASIQMLQGKTIGVFGELHPRTIQVFSLEHPCIAFELNLDELLA